MEVTPTSAENDFDWEKNTATGDLALVVSRDTCGVGFASERKKVARRKTRQIEVKIPLNVLSSP